MTPTLKLTCRECDWQPNVNQTMQEVLDHYQNAHKIDRQGVSLNLSAICECGSVMDFQRSVKAKNHTEDFFKCFKCNRTGSIQRYSKHDS